MIDQLLAFALLEEGRGSLSLEPVDAREVAREATMIVGRDAPAKGLALHLDLPDSPIELHTDPNKVRQILLNLLGNAIKYTEQGEVGLAVRFGADDRVTFEVRDTGIGLAPENWDRVFERFTRIEDEGLSKAAGTGLGLAVVRRLSRLLGGDVQVKSEIGRGSTFTVWLPRHPSPAGCVLGPVDLERVRSDHSHPPS